MSDITDDIEAGWERGEAIDAQFGVDDPKPELGLFQLPGSRGECGGCGQLRHRGPCEERFTRNEWATPAWLFDRLNDEFHFTIDVAASRLNTKVPDYFFSKSHDGLSRPWIGSVWCNPPYDRSIGDWVAYGHTQARRNDTDVVMLIPAYTSTEYWHRHVMKADEIRFIEGRVRFDSPFSNGPGGAGKRRGNWSPPWSSVIVIWTNGRLDPVAGPIIRSLRK